MKDEEFVKLRMWLDAEFTIMHIFMAVLLGFIVHRVWAWVIIAVYVLFSLIYAAARINYVESKHKGYLKIPRSWN